MQRPRLLLFALLVSFIPLWAQSPTATIDGRVLDPLRAVIDRARVEAINIDTNVRYSSETNSAGLFTIVSLPPGAYRIEVSKPGFRTIVNPGIVLHVQDVLALNFEMPIGSTLESITVTSETPLVNTKDASVSTVVDRNLAENLPMNGRSFQTLIQLTPGVVVTPSSLYDGGQFSVNGQRPSSNYWMVDGVGANIGVGSGGVPGNGFSGALGSFSALGGTNSLVSIDAMQEFRIQTSTYAPEFGRTPGAQVSIVTRSGTNQFHGTLFEYFRNDVLDASDWFNGYVNDPPLPKAKERQNDFGGTLSGPILKGRTFFFFSYEGLRLRLPQTTLTDVPCTSTCTVFGDARGNAPPAMQPFLNAFPLPNGPEEFAPCQVGAPGCPASGLAPTGAAQFNASYSNPAALNAYSLRVDHRLFDKLNIFARYNYSPSEILQRGYQGASLNTLTPNRITTQTATVGLNWLLSPTVMNDLRFNFSRTSASTTQYLDAFGGATVLPSLPLPAPFTSQNSLFDFSINSLQGGFIEIGHLLSTQQRQINIVDSVSVQKAEHALKFGVDFRRLSPFNGPASYYQNAFFNDVSSTESGVVDFASVVASRTGALEFRNLGLYAQDTWRVLPRLTLTYGIRWEFDFAPDALSGPNFPAVTGFNLGNLSNLALAPTGTEPFATTTGNFSPRVGIAWQLRRDPKYQTVFRGGFGVFSDLATSEAGNILVNSGYPFLALKFSSGVPFPLDGAAAAVPPIVPPTPSNPGSVAAFDPHLKLPYTLQWSAAVEQSLGQQQSLSLSYVGASGRRLLQTADIFNANPTFSQAYLISNTASSGYNALQVQLRRPLSHGIQALASYTWSHSIDNGSAGSPLIGSNAFVPGMAANANRGPSDFDIRHAFSGAITYRIPDANTGVLGRAALHGWSVDTVIQARSASPVNVSDVNFAGVLTTQSFGIVRPDLVAGEPLYLQRSGFPGGKAFNPTAFTDPPVDPTTGFPSRQGTTPRNFLRGFGATQWDFAAHREFPITEAVKLQFRAELFNLLNHPNFGPPASRFGFGGFGVSNQTLGQSLSGGNLGGGAFSPLYQIGGPRSIQLALKLQF
jgi:hypothetical protein